MTVVTQSIVIVALLIVFNQQSAAQPHPLWHNLQPGRYAVGFKVEHRYDSTRTDKRKVDYSGKRIAGPRARPLQLSVWYPAQESARARMAFTDYINQMATETDFQALSKQVRSNTIAGFFVHPIFEGLTRRQKEVLMHSSTAAVKDAPSFRGRFPLIVFGQGLGYESAVSHSVLCEYLASNGYVVATVPYLGMSLQQEPLDAAGLENEARDLEFAIAESRKLSMVDPDKLGVAGFDFGGLAALIVSMRNTDVDAILSLDSGIIFQHNLALLKQSPFFKTANLRVPLMQITKAAQNNSTAGLVEDLSVLQAKYSTTYLLRFSEMRHVDFTSYRMISLFANGATDLLRTQKRAAYELLCRYSLNFLDAYLKNKQEARQFLVQDAEQNGPGILSITLKPSVPAPPTEREFFAVLKQQGVDRAIELATKFGNKQTGEVLFKEENLNTVAYEVLQSGKIEEAIKLFTLNVTTFPDSWNAYDSLGEAYTVKGDKTNAIHNYQKSLQLNPNNTHAREMLKKLRD